MGTRQPPTVSSRTKASTQGQCSALRHKWTRKWWRSTAIPCVWLVSWLFSVVAHRHRDAVWCFTKTHWVQPLHRSQQQTLWSPAKCRSRSPSSACQSGPREAHVETAGCGGKVATNKGNVVKNSARGLVEVWPQSLGSLKQSSRRQRQKCRKRKAVISLAEREAKEERQWWAPTFMNTIQFK